MKQAIAYYRVSTQRQGRSGLGLEAQQSAVGSYCRNNAYELINEIVEVKSTRKRQLKLWEALRLCKKEVATLVVARLDRLGRDVELIARLVKSEVEIIVADNPHATRFTIHILAAVAEEQRRRISEATKDALAAAKCRGKVLGKNGKVLAAANRRAAVEFAWLLEPLIERLRAEGLFSIRAVTNELNRRKVPTFRSGGQWHVSTVCAILKRLRDKSP